VLEQLQQDAQSYTIEIVDMLNNIYGTSYSVPSIIFDSKIRKIAGEANCSNYTIKLSNKLLLDYGKDFINIIVPHEVAHLFNFRVNNGREHDEGWVNMMNELGVTSLPGHTFK
jgi:predicted SprT family Zn-dependent metalloprotease